MAGSSMDGIDLALVKFKNTDLIDFTVEFAQTIAYPPEIFSLLSSAISKSKSIQNEIDELFGDWIAEQINTHFSSWKIDLVSVHGHTLIHDPIGGISWQLGNGQIIADKTGINCISNFRNKDISLGGQGAPLVPFGDFSLFEEYDACLNLGGIANISLKENKSAWDICPCNQVLNFYSKKLGFAFDKDGKFGRKGITDDFFLKELFTIKYFKEKPPKSLPNAFIDESILNSVSPLDGLASYYEFITQQVSFDLKGNISGKMLITGGGAHNSFLVEKLKHAISGWIIIIPDEMIIDFKEAVIFAYLGLLKYKGKINTLASSTGASQDSSGGEINLPK